MNARDTVEFRKYVDLVARKHGGLEGLRELVKNRPARSGGEGALESMPGEPVLDGRTPKATAAIEALDRGDEPAPPEIEALEAIIDEDLRPVIDVIKGKFNSTHFLWTKLNTDALIR